MSPAKWEDVAWESDGETVNVEETQYLRAESEGERLPDNPPSEEKWKALKGLNRLKLNGAEHDVMGCLIDVANSKTGLCYPSEAYIAGWIDRPLRTVQRAIRSLRRKRLIRVIWRSQASSRYYPDWRRLFTAFRQIESFVLGHASSRAAASKVADQDVKSGGSHPSKVAAKPSESNYLSMNSHHEMVLSPEAKDTHVIDSFLEGLSSRNNLSAGGETPKASKREPAAKPSSPAYAEARRKVLSELDSFDETWLSDEGLEAAAAEEMKEPGSGRGIARGLATLSWQQYRKREAS